MPIDWQPIATLPQQGHFILAYYAPTRWAFYAATIRFYAEDTPRLRAMRLRYVRAWAPAPAEPPTDINEGPTHD